MQTKHGHLTYCTNIHGGEAWDDHFNLLKKHFPVIKQQVADDVAMGLGLRLSNQATKELLNEGYFDEFQAWLAAENAYVFTLNGFPYGDFHQDVVKEAVHAPDWSTVERLDYTKRLFDILVRLLPSEMDGGVSTSPLGYRHDYLHSSGAWDKMMGISTQHIIELVIHLIELRNTHGKVLHLDIEPEPDGVLENGPEFIDWYTQVLLPKGKKMLRERLGIEEKEAEGAIKMHVRICYDVCHFALGYENHEAVINQLNVLGIQIGKFQISAAIKAELSSEDREAAKQAFMAFNEPKYLHQVIAKQEGNTLIRYRDLPEAQEHVNDANTTEWRAHFHVPIFLEDLGLLKATQSDIADVLALQMKSPLTEHLEVETYTWGVLPESLQLPVAESISRELNWVVTQLT